MIRTILVPTAGTDSDETVFRTALAVARPLAAHLRFWHAHLRPSEAIAYTPHGDFAVGSGTRAMLEQLVERAKRRSTEAMGRCVAFCRSEAIPLVAGPAAEPFLSASFEEESDNVLERLIMHARHSDMIVAARPKHENGLPEDLVERVLLNSGRPLLLAAAALPRLSGTIMICWKETEEAARAVAAAAPLLCLAQRVLLVGVRETNGIEQEELADMAARLAWLGVAAKPVYLARQSKSPAERILALARQEGADLLIMGAYGRKRAIELFFGGFTRSILQHAELPVFLMH